MPISKQSRLEKVRTLVGTLVFSNYYGELNLKFESGNIIHIRMTQSYKLDDYGTMSVAEGAGTHANSPK